MATSDESRDLPTSVEERCGEIYFELEGAARDEAFQTLCGAHPRLSAGIQAYRDRIQRGDKLLDGAPLDLSLAPASEPPIPEKLGPYRILELVGQGGFGTVYRAEQHEPVRRIVAVKVLRGRHADQGVRRRFEIERQTLARMQHACIAQVLDAGQTDDGQPYIVMEFVDGQPLTQWCDRHRLGVRGRLLLFSKVCAAVQHAHQRGVVHRDLKPGNILVREESGKPSPKVIDFGVAKLLEDDDSTQRVAATREGAWIGTPGYMSPEQVVGGAIDTRTDVYALGVLLFELLTGVLPHAREHVASSRPAVLAKVVCEDPPRSLASALPASREKAICTATHRGCRMKSLRRLLRGDLDWVVRKAIAVAPDQRYASVSELIQDIEAYSRNEPVSARESAALYVLRRFAGRHRIGVGIAVGGLLFAIAGFVVLLWFLAHLDEARSAAIDQRMIADEQRLESARNEYHAHIAAAQGALRLGMVSGARGHLLACDSAYRGWEWRFLASQLDSSLSRHLGPGDVSQVQWLDEDRLLICYYAHDAEIWNTEADTLERRIPMRSSNPRATYDRTSRRFYSVADAHHVEVWLAPEWARQRVLLTAKTNISAMELSPNGQMLLVAEVGGTVHSVDPLGHSASRSWMRSEEHIVDIKFLPSGDRVAVTHFLGAVEVRDATTGAVVKTLAQSGNFTALAVANETVFGFGTRRIQAWSAKTAATVARASTRQEIARMRVSTDGRVLYGSGGFGAAEVSAWDTTTLEVVGRFFGHRSGVLALDVHPDGTRIATGSTDSSTRIWTASARATVRRLQAGFDARHLAVSPNGDCFASANRRGQVMAWDARTLEELLTVETGVELRGCTMGASHIYAAGSDLHVFDLASGSEMIVDVPSDMVDGLAIDPQERWLVGTNEATERLWIWQLPGMKMLAELELTVRPHMAFDTVRDQFVVGRVGGAVSLLDPVECRVVETVSHAGIIFNLALHAREGGTKMATASEQLHVRDHLGASAKWVAHGAGTFGVDFSPDGKRLATGGGDYLARLWSTDGSELLVLEASQKPIIHVRFAAGGRTLLGLSHSWSNPTEVLVWQAPDRVEIAR